MHLKLESFLGSILREQQEELKGLCDNVVALKILYKKAGLKSNFLDGIKAQGHSY